MKIDDQGFELSRAAGVQPVQRSGPVFSLYQSAGISPPRGPDQASVSAESQEIQRYASALSALPDIRPERVAAAQARLNGQAPPVAMDDLAEAMFRLAELDQHG